MPVIVLISSFLDEPKVKKADNIFVIKVPFDVKSLKKILIFLKRYYMNCINHYKLKNNLGSVTKINSKDEIAELIPKTVES